MIVVLYCFNCSSGLWLLDNSYSCDGCFEIHVGSFGSIGMFKFHLVSLYSGVGCLINTGCRFFLTFKCWVF